MTCPLGTRHDSGRPWRDEKTGIVEPAAGPAESCNCSGAGTGAQAPVPFAISEIDVHACRALWCAVLIESWNLAVAPTNYDRPFEIDYARRWFGTSDFIQVCDLAGVGGDDVMRAYRHACSPGAGFRLTIQKQTTGSARRSS